MKRSLISFLLLILAFVKPNFSSAQEAEVPKLVWEVTKVNLGTILQEDGPQVATFNFTHTQDSVLVLTEVLTDCGCTTADYTQDSLMVGERGSVSILFDPISSAGDFSRMVIVKGNLHSVEDTLFLEGTSIPFPDNPLLDYPEKRLDYGFRLPKVNLGDVFTNEPKRKFIEVFNFGAIPLMADSLRWAAPEYIQLRQVEDSIPSQDRGLLEIIYDGQLKGDLGFFEDQIGMGWETGNQFPLELIGDIFEFYAAISREELSIKPQLEISRKEIDLKEIPVNQIQEEEVTLTNRGQQVLEIKKIQGNCNCLKLEAETTSINPGQTITLNISFDPKGRQGIDQRNIYVFSNDPVNPVQLIILKSRVK